MIYEVELKAFQNGKIRQVDVPYEEKMTENGSIDYNFILEKIYEFGQNYVQVVEGCCSVSVGDIIHIKGKRFEVADFGFKEIT